MRVIYWRVGRRSQGASHIGGQPRAQARAAAVGVRRDRSLRQVATLLLVALTTALWVAILAWPVIWPALSVAIDAGHGGIDPGAIGLRGLAEKTVTLDVARRVASILGEAGIATHLTRVNDARLGSSQRSDLRARVRLAHESSVDILVSIHVNSYRSRKVRGPRTYYQPGSVRGRALATCIQRQLRQAVGYGSHAPVAEDHLITRESKMAAVIVELGYISNPDEERQLRSPAWRQELAEAVSLGILYCEVQR